MNPQTADAAAVIVLGKSQGKYSIGYGKVKPRTLSESSMCGGTVTNIVWTGWGKKTARGVGKPCLGAAERNTGRRVVYIASNIGRCRGSKVLAYRKLSANGGKRYSIC